MFIDVHTSFNIVGQTLRIMTSEKTNMHYILVRRGIIQAPLSLSCWLFGGCSCLPTRSLSLHLLHTLVIPPRCQNFIHIVYKYM
jgi:hypothetical protein